MLNFNNSLRARRLDSHGIDGVSRPKISGIVLHDTAGSGTSADAKYLANDPEDRKVSVDFVVCRDGEIFKLNPDLTRYWTNHAGRHTRFKDWANRDVNANTVGIEIAHKADPHKDVPEWPDAQIEAVAGLCAKLVGDYGLNPTSEISRNSDITTHAAIITDGSRTDPRNFPWTLFWGYFDAANSGTTPPIVPKSEGSQIYYVVVAGDTLWGIANKYHTSIENIKALNHFDTPSTLITVGQRLLVKE